MNLLQKGGICSFNYNNRITEIKFHFCSDPNNPQDECLKNLKWDLYTPGQKEYLEIGDDLKMKTGGIYTDRFEVWEKLFPIDQKP